MRKIVTDLFVFVSFLLVSSVPIPARAYILPSFGPLGSQYNPIYVEVLPKSNGVDMEAINRLKNHTMPPQPSYYPLYPFPSASSPPITPQPYYGRLYAPSTPLSYCPDTVNSSIASDGKCYCKTGYVWSDAKQGCVSLISTVAPVPSTASQPQSTLEEDAQSFGITLGAADMYRLGRFIEDGSDAVTRVLGSGERRALVRDAFDTMGRAPTSGDMERLANGQIPLSRNLAREHEQLSEARVAFRLIYGHNPNFQNYEENLAWNTLMYRIRFSRDLVREQRGIVEYRRLFGRTPSTPFHWATVRVLGYVR